MTLTQLRRLSSRELMEISGKRKRLGGKTQDARNADRILRERACSASVQLSETVYEAPGIVELSQAFARNSLDPYQRIQLQETGVLPEY